MSESGYILCPALAPHLGLGYPLAVGKPTLVSITPSVLTWAMRESGYEPDFVAGKVGVPPATLTKWLHGRDQPNALASDVPYTWRKDTSPRRVILIA